MSDGEIDLGYDGWAIVELFGHRRIAGRVTAAQPLDATDRIRVDIYDGAAPAPSITQYMSYPQAVYCLTPTTEAIARQVGARCLRDAAPAAQWELEAPRRLVPDDDDPDDYPDGDDPADLYGNA